MLRLPLLLQCLLHLLCLPLLLQRLLVSLRSCQAASHALLLRLLRLLCLLRLLRPLLSAGGPRSVWSLQEVQWARPCD